MKKFAVILSAVAMLVAATSANAMYGGIKAGVNLANLAGDEVDDTSMRTGIQGGVFLGTNFTEQFGARLEALYVQKGAKEDVEIIPGTNVEVTYKLDYIELPILFVANLPAGESAVFNLFAGPTLAFNMKADAEADGESDEIEDVKGFEFGAAIGLGLQWMMASGKAIVADARYSLGASSIIDVEDVDVKNRGIGIMLGLQFPLGGSSE